MDLIDAKTLESLIDYPSLCSELLLAHQRPIPVNADICLEHPGSADRFMLRPAWAQQEMLGVKLATIFPDNHYQPDPKPSVQGVYVAFDGLRGTPLFVAEGATLTALKTAADSALGLQLLARHDVSTLLMVGAGDMALPLIGAFTSIRPSLSRILVWNRSLPRAEQLAARLQASGIECLSTDDLDSAVAQADVICSATMSEEPLLRGALLKPGTHVSLVGAWRPHMREADDELMSRSQIYVDFRDTALASGELCIPLQRGVISQADVLADLYDLCRHPPAVDPNAITVFKNAGGAHLDLFTAQFLQRRIIASKTASG
ncbi:ornithine cyclodeaminase family protein [uncultured Pseudomonas sp.]|uniref:ornithine cyclodeaminase family protein n=1 Tax=uncultured Pseudomonas sp. TaxID=114707 RepID=UPI0025CC6CE5|nr:ornithine cyclodeaminase family protein [uncultured Pseudomonas sp.]